MKRRRFFKRIFPARPRTRPHPRPRPLPRPPKRRRGRRLSILLVILTLFAGAFAYGYYRFDRHILPLVLASADLELKTVINSAIYTEVQKIIRDRGVDASDFYINSLEPGGGNVLAVNTVLVNDICNSAALAISDKLSGMEPAPVSVPVGMAFGLDTLANAGPEFTFRLRPTGNALVNYETKFEAVGINQVHFMVWLTVVSTVKIINPVQSATVTVTREVSLVDTVITGTVPDTYLGMEQGLY